MTTSSEECIDVVNRASKWAQRYFEEVRPKLRQSRFRYIDLALSQLLYVMPAGSGCVYVIGHPEQGAYEWVYYDHNQIDPCVEFSNQGWGGCDCAMREGLIVATR